MVDLGNVSQSRQWFWALIFVGLILGGVALAFAIRDTELVTPDIVQRQWLENKQRR